MLAESTTPPSSEQKESKSGKLDLIGMFPQWEHAKNLKGDVAAGREIYTRLGLDSPFSCQACHGFDKDDTMEVDSLGLIRVGPSIYAASHRTNTKNSGIRNAALGGNICVLHFFHGKSPGMAAQELAHLDAFLKTGGAANHPTAQNIPYDRMTYPVPPAVLTGGDVAKGKAIAMSRCVSCHAVGDVEAKYGAVGVSLAAGEWDYLTLDELAHRIRNIDDKNNDYMPGFSNLVLTDEEMIDLLAWLTKK
jgi:mono/diheme cytochrome c family protein